MNIAENIAAVRERITVAARRAGRDPEVVALMAVCKTKPAEEIRAAYEAGQRLFGENRVQEFHEKSGDLQDLMIGPDLAEFHLIGHLQSNKTNRAAEIFQAIDSVDSLAVLERLHTAALRLNKHLPILIEVNIGGEDQKAGLSPDSQDLEQILHAAPSLLAISIRGLMTVPPFTDDPEGARPYFRRLRELRDQIAARKLPAIGMEELSMGMSHDFEVAIQEGSTCVRVGTAIFGARNYP
jgi:hypothetical protein